MKKDSTSLQKKPQVMLEFIIMAFISLIVVAGMVWFFGVYGDYAERIFSLISLDYP